MSELFQRIAIWIFGICPEIFLCLKLPRRGKSACLELKTLIADGPGFIRQDHSLRRRRRTWPG